MIGNTIDNLYSSNSKYTIYYKVTTGVCIVGGIEGSSFSIISATPRIIQKLKVLLGTGIWI